MKFFYLAILFFIPLTSACSSVNLYVEEIGDTYAIAVYEEDLFSEIVNDYAVTKLIKNHCAPLDFKIIERGRETTGQYRAKHRILFRCVDKKERN